MDPDGLDEVLGTGGSIAAAAAGAPQRMQRALMKVW